MKKRDQWRKKGERKRSSRKMPEEVKQELATNKAEKKTTEDDKYMERFHRSQRLTAQNLARDRRRTQALREDYFKRVYGDVWQEVMLGVRADVEGRQES